MRVFEGGGFLVVKVHKCLGEWAKKKREHFQGEKSKLAKHYYKTQEGQIDQKNNI